MILVSKCSFVLATGKGIAFYKVGIIDELERRKEMWVPKLTFLLCLVAHIWCAGMSLHSHLRCLICEIGPSTYFRAFVRVSDIVCETCFISEKYKYKVVWTPKYIHCDSGWDASTLGNRPYKGFEKVRHHLCPPIWLPASRILFKNTVEVCSSPTTWKRVLSNHCIDDKTEVPPKQENYSSWCIF